MEKDVEIYQKMELWVAGLSKTSLKRETRCLDNLLHANYCKVLQVLMFLRYQI